MNPLCEVCGAPVTRRPGKANRFCSLACYHVSGPRGNRVERTRHQRLKRAPTHPLAPPSGMVAECRMILYDKLGPGPHPCHWCGALLQWRPGQGLVPDALLADHLDWDIHNNDPANLVPSCNSCNAHRTRGGGRALIRDDEPVVVNANGSRTRAHEVFCHICGVAFLARVAELRKGKGRFCSRSCARRNDARMRAS